MNINRGIFACWAGIALSFGGSLQSKVSSLAFLIAGRRKWDETIVGHVCQCAYSRKWMKTARWLQARGFCNKSESSRKVAGGAFFISFLAPQADVRQKVKSSPCARSLTSSRYCKKCFVCKLVDCLALSRSGRSAPVEREKWPERRATMVSSNSL